MIKGDGFVTANNNDSRFLYFDAGAGLNLFWDVGGTAIATNVSIADYDDSTHQIQELSVDGTNATLRINGTQNFTTATSNALEIDRLGLKWDGVTSVTTWNGEIAEIVMISNLSTSDRAKMEGYLAWKWGLEANLDAGHPYKSAPPTA